MSGAPLIAAGRPAGGLPRRPSNFAGFLLCAGLILYALYAQYHLQLDPCPLCIFQRIGIIALGVVFLIAALHNPRAWGTRVYTTLIAIAALATVAVAARQLYIQHLPPGAIPSCGAPLSMMWRFMPFTTMLRKVLSGSGECGVVNWTFLGLAMPAWVLIWAAFLGTAGVAANFRRT
ncbi:MAG TPA: disulfide bond formation protein B [Steroidobacteraceae bacterium]|nr:disulfide bond formation protein B [Steroidobacteraceae bacterium]